MAIHFPGTARQTSFFNAVNIDHTQFTMACAFNNHQATLTRTNHLFQLFRTSDNRNITSISIPTSKFVRFFYAWSGGGGLWEWEVALSDDTWFAIAAVYDRSSTANNPRLFVNGIERPMTPLPGPVGTPETSQDSIIIADNNPGTQKIEDGDLAECAYWNRILDDPELIALTLGDSARFFAEGLTFHEPWITASGAEERQGLDWTTVGSPMTVDHIPLKSVPRPAESPPRPAAAPPQPTDDPALLTLLGVG